jgi:hypothetical protein
MIKYLAALTLPEFTGFIGVIAAMLAGFYGIAKMMLSQATKDREADREERKEFSRAIQKMAESSEKVAEEASLSRQVQEKGFAEAEKRNGHLAEISIDNKDAILKAIKSVSVQNIKEQNVEHQTVKE